MDRFYYGLLLGTTLNTVKNQDRNKFGFDIGFIGGYRFNRHISVETGVLFSQKYYTTAGEYFSLKEIGPMMPAAMKVMDVKGTSKVVEIPVYLRYNVLNKKEHRFFSSAGFSSYILTKESNQYFTSLNGTEGIMYGTYKTNRSYFAASFDLAIGYEKNFGKKSSIRFQPYVQLPVKGIGVGNLKVMSTGVHIAITRSSQ
ncbi:MAG: PorT family protein [Flavisolibacter sp.]|nr:PorT family protein [Flavisolibacter sp.]